MGQSIPENSGMCKITIGKNAHETDPAIVQLQYFRNSHAEVCRGKDTYYNYSSIWSGEEGPADCK